MNRKKAFALCIAVVMAFSSLIAGFAVFGSDVAWHFDSNSATLYIHGTSKMDDYADEFSTPWNTHTNAVKKVIIDEGITTIGAYAFAGMSKLKSVDIPSTVSSINSCCMASCPSLKSLYLGENITSISDDYFATVGDQRKADFVVNTVAGSYPLYYVIKNDIAFSADSVSCGSYKTVISVAGMKGYYPYTPKCDGTFRFYSSGSFDTIGYLYDSSFKMLAKNDDASSSNTNFSITAQLKKGETYYINSGLFSSGLRGSFDFTIEANSFTVDCSVVSMADPSGAASNIPVNDVTVDGENLGSNFVIDVTGGSVTKQFCYKNQSQYVTFTPDDDSVVVFMTCDVNCDGYVNAKDFAIMRKEKSDYLELYKNFINYRC